MPADLLRRFYDARAREQPARDPEATVRFGKALRAAGLKPGESVLDVGAKSGGFGAHARAAGLDLAYTGLELSPENAAKGRERGLDVRVADVTGQLPVANASFDCVVCLEVIEHVTHPVALALEMRRALKPSGRLVLSVPNPYSWVEVAREIFGKPDPEGHLSAFTRPVMSNLLALAGFRLLEHSGTSVRVPMTGRIVPTNSILARSRIYVAAPADRVVFSGRTLRVS